MRENLELNTRGPGQSPQLVECGANNTNVEGSSPVRAITFIFPPPKIESYFLKTSLLNV